MCRRNTFRKLKVKGRENMGFLKSFFGAAAANAIRDSKKEQERLNNWNALFDEASDMSLEFSD